MSSIQTRSAFVLPGGDPAEDRLSTIGTVAAAAESEHAVHARGASSVTPREWVGATAEPMPSYHREITSGGVASQAEGSQVRNVAPVPRITIGAFCENHDVLTVLESAARDRLMSRATLDTYAGGIKAAVEFCQHNPVPNLLIVESRAPNAGVLAELEGLANVCEPGTKVLVVGYSNDISFYRELLSRGVSEYLVAPLAVVPLVGAISGIYRERSAEKLGQVYAFVGARGGCGSSTIAHNVAWTMARRFASEVVIADLDLPFGTAALNLNVDTSQGIGEAVQDSSRLDEVLFDRLLTRCDEHLSVLAAPAALHRSYDFGADAFETLLEVAQANVPFTVLDVPHVWSGWARNALAAADEIIITAEPDLASLRNAKNIVGFLKQERPNDPPPKLLLNKVGMPKRPEIKPQEFARALELKPLASIAFDAQLFGTAANNGKLIAGTSANATATQAFADIAATIAGRREVKRDRKPLAAVRALLSRVARQG